MPDAAEQVSCRCVCGRTFAFLSQRAAHREAGGCPMPDLSHLRVRVSQLRCSVPRNGRHCSQLLVELARDPDGGLAYRTWTERGRRVTSEGAEEFGAWLEANGAMPAADYVAMMSDLEGVQPTERADMGWLRLDDSIFDNGLTGTVAICTHHGPVQISRDFLFAVAEARRRAVPVDARQRRIGYLSR